MRSRHNKRRRSRISPIDRLLRATKKGRVIFPAVSSDQTELPSHSKPENRVNPATDLIQYPIRWQPVMILGFAWVLMLGIIWGAVQEIMSLGVSQTTQTLAQVERKSLIELFGSIGLGSIGLSLVLTPALKRPRRDHSELFQENIDRTANK